jgi:hypothetical protein
MTDMAKAAAVPAMTQTNRGARAADIGFNPKGLAGLQSRRLRGLRAGKFGAATKGRRLTADECRAIEDQMRRAGALNSETQGNDNG